MSDDSIFYGSSLAKEPCVRVLPWRLQWGVMWVVRRSEERVGRRYMNQQPILITRALHFAQLRLRPLNYTLRPNVIVTLA